MDVETADKILQFENAYASRDKITIPNAKKTWNMFPETPLFDGPINSLDRTKLAKIFPAQKNPTPNLQNPIINYNCAEFSDSSCMEIITII